MYLTKYELFPENISRNEMEKIIQEMEKRKDSYDEVIKSQICLHRLRKVKSALYYLNFDFQEVFGDVMGLFLKDGETFETKDFGDTIMSDLQKLVLDMDKLEERLEKEGF